MAKFPSEGVVKALEKLLPGSRSNNGSPLSIGALGGSGHNVVFSRSSLMYSGSENGTMECLVSSSRDVLDEAVLPEARLERYALLEEMAAYPTLSAALNIHISYAFSINKHTNKSFRFKPIIPTDDQNYEEAQKLCDELMDDIGRQINEELPGWGMVMAILGVCYIRPYATQKVGITSFQCDYYTLPYFVREYYVGGDLAGFTGDYLKDPAGNMVFAKPWDIVAMKTPYWRPRRNQIPIYTGTEQFSLLSDPADRVPQETQNYGTSILEYAYEPYTNLRSAIKALKASRFNASKVDRLIAVNTDSLDPSRNAKYTRTLSQTLKREADMMERRARGQNSATTVTNTILPMMGNGKGQMQIDTQTLPPDITAIEDVMLHFKQLAASVGLDYTMLGFADQMSGGLGEGGFLRTSIQAGMIAGWLRGGATEMINRMCDIHLAMKYGKAYTPGTRPFGVEFNSMATSIELEENAAMDARANYASVVVQIVDAICNSPTLAQSETFQQLVMGDILKIPDDRLDQVLKELQDAGGDQHDMTESIESRKLSDPELAALICGMSQADLKSALEKALL